MRRDGIRRNVRTNHTVKYCPTCDELKGHCRNHRYPENHHRQPFTCKFSHGKCGMCSLDCKYKARSKQRRYKKEAWGFARQLKDELFDEGFNLEWDDVDLLWNDTRQEHPKTFLRFCGNSDLMQTAWELYRCKTKKITCKINKIRMQMYSFLFENKHNLSQFFYHLQFLIWVRRIPDIEVEFGGFVEHWLVVRKCLKRTLAMIRSNSTISNSTKRQVHGGEVH